MSKRRFPPPLRLLWRVTLAFALALEASVQGIAQQLVQPLPPPATDSVLQLVPPAEAAAEPAVEPSDKPPAKPAPRRRRSSRDAQPSTSDAPVVRPARRRQVFSAQEIAPNSQTREKIDSLIEEVLLPEVTFDLDPAESKLIRTKRPVSRFSVTNPEIVEVVQFSPTEWEMVGLAAGHTSVTLWFDVEDGEPREVLRYLVRVAQSEQLDTLDQAEYGDLQDRINELFPNSMVQLIPVLDKLIVRGQARDAEEAAQILALLSGQATDQTGRLLGPGALINTGTVGGLTGEEAIQARNVINLMDVPGEQQIMLKVRVAELSRAAGRTMGSDLLINSGDFSLSSLLGGTAGPVRAVLTTDEVTLALQALSSNSYSKILAEPNLMTINGRPASFIAGGQFAVPTVVGIGGVGAASTQFQSFGTQLSFTPTVIDKDRIRLTVVPTISSVNSGNSVNGIPGLNTRTVSTTVDLREGQWLAIAGLIEDNQTGSETRAPLLGDLPGIGLLFSSRSVSRAESEMIILVSPEMVHPLEADEVPCLLPGMEVTEPNDWAFFLGGRYEGNPNCQHRSTVWPIQQERIYDAHREASRSAKCHGALRHNQEYYIQGEVGFSQ